MTKGAIATLYGIDENWPVDLILGLVLGALFIGVMDTTSLTMGTVPPIYPLTPFAEAMGVIGTLIVIGFLAPVGEEPFFRGIFMWFGWQNLKYFTIAVIAVGIAFAAFHFDTYGAHLPAAYVGAFLFSTIACIVTHQTKSLLPSIIMHSMVNIYLYIQAEQLMVVGT